MLKGKVKTSHPVYYVRDMKASLAFYVEKLGLPICFDMSEYKVMGVEINEGAQIILCEGAERVSKDAPVLVFEIEDVDGVYAGLKARGVEFEGPPSDEFYGRAVDLKDPDGYRLCLVETGE